MVIYDSGLVPFEHLLLSWYSSQLLSQPTLDSDYPMKPPRVLFLTESGQPVNFFFYTTDKARHKIVKASWKTVKARYMTVKARCKTVNARFRTVITR